jgi:hypothetical protein
VNFGVTIHVLLFNLCLADRGYRENVMGRQAALMTIGAALATFPWAAVARRFGLHFTSLLTSFGLAAALVLRAQTSGWPLSVASVLTGLFLGGWHVTNTPSIAAFSLEATGFSLNIGLSMAIGALGGLIGGRLPAFILAVAPGAARDLSGAMPLALVAAAIPVFAASAVLAGIRFPETPAASANQSRLHFPRSLFLARFLPAVALWYVFSAGFIPFFNAYLRNQIGGSTAAIGGAYAISMIPQAAATLLMSLVIARFGLIRSVAGTQVLAALGVLAMLGAHTVPQATLFYTVYISLQVMSEPGLSAALMRGVPSEQRPAAMAANLLLIFAINATVSTAAGQLIVTRGYSALFIALSVTGLAAALLFAFLFRGRNAEKEERTALSTRQ